MFSSISRIIKQNFAFSALHQSQRIEFAKVKFHIVSCLSCGTRTMNNRVLQHLREKYEQKDGHEVEIISATATQFDHSYEVFVTAESQPDVKHQVWSKTGGDEGIFKENFARFDARIDAIINPQSNQETSQSQ